MAAVTVLVPSFPRRLLWVHIQSLYYKRCIQLVMILDTSADFAKYFFTAVQSLCSSASRVAELKPVLACNCKGDGEEWTNSGA